MTVKVVFYSFSETKVPVMLINLSGRSIISIPTQIGCAIGCTFCLSPASKFERSLTADELVALVEQVLDAISLALAASQVERC